MVPLGQRRAVGDAGLMDGIWAAHRLAAQQYGVISRAQALRCGMTRHQVRRHVHQELWVPVHRGVYQVRVYRAATPRGHLLAAVLAAQLALGPDAFACAETAARLWGMKGLPPWEGDVHMGLLPGSTRLSASGVVVHTWPTEPADITRRGPGIRLTRPGRTLRDVLLRLDRSAAVCLLDSALHFALAGAAQLDGLAAANTGRPGAARSRSWWDLADGRAQSPLETRVRLICFDEGIPPDELQHPFYDCRGHLIGRGDMWWEDSQLVVEADGREPHELPTALFRDRHRQNALELSHPGIRILRFTWADLHTPGYIPATIKKVLLPRGAFK